jgi:hypothetical protein
MVTRRQVDANRKNWARGTGPKTLAGKMASSRSSFKAVLLNRELILPGESREDFDALFDQLILEHKPIGVLKISLLERVAVTMRRQRRLVGAERAQIWKSQLSQTIEAKQRMAPDDDLPDQELALRYLESEPWVSHIDDFEKECKRFHLAKDFRFDRFRDHYPLLAMVYAEPESSKLYKGTQAIGGALGDECGRDRLVQQQAMWLQAIAQHRESSSIGNVMRDFNAIPPAAENLSRYQAALDNEWYKAMRAFREARSYRLKTIEQVNSAKNQD